MAQQEWKAECSLSLQTDPLFVSYWLLVFLCRVVCKASSKLLTQSTQAACSDVRCDVSAPLSLFPCSQTPAWTHVSHSGPSLYSRKDSYWYSYCLFALFMFGNSLRANGSVMQSFTFAVHSVLLPISLMMFIVRHWVPFPLKTQKWELGCKRGTKWMDHGLIGVIKFQCLEG